MAATREAVTPVDQLRAGRTTLAVGLLAALAAGPAWLASPVLATVAASLAWLAGLAGVNQVARPLGWAPLTRWGAMAGAFVPGVNLPVIGWALWKAHTGIPALLAEARAQHARAARATHTGEHGTLPPSARHAPVAEAAPAADSELAVARAIACIKRVGVGDLPEGAAVPTEGGALKAEQAPVCRATKGVFGVMYRVETAQGFVYVNQKQLQAAHLSLEQLHGLAMRNLEARVQRKPGLKVSSKNGLNTLKLDGEHEASILLLDELWEGPLIKLAPNGALVAMPTRNVCVFCDLRHAEGAAQLSQLAQDVTAKKGPGQISPQLLVRQHGRWRLA
jgi:hypothetical protein